MNEFDDDDLYYFSIKIVGDDGVGKSSLFNCYVNPQKSFQEAYLSSMRVDSKKCAQEIMPQQSINLEIWDSIPQETHFASVNPYNGHHAILIVCDLTNQASFDDIPKKIKDIKQSILLENPLIFLVGTKNDLKNDLKISSDQLKALASEQKCTAAMCVSAKTGENVEELFKEVGASIHRKSMAQDEKPIENIPAERRDVIVKEIKTDLENYTSSLTKFFCYVKWIISFGQLRVGLEKQLLAEALKQELENSIDKKATIKSYEEKHQKLVKQEYLSSNLCLFKNNVIDDEALSYKIASKRGKLGDILAKGFRI